MPYPGGKNHGGTYHRIINQIPPHTRYLELFLGGGAIMRLKRPADLTVGIDLDQAALDMVGALIARNGDAFRKVILLQGDALEFLDANRERAHMHTPQTFIYLDPPYLMSTRATKRPRYAFEFGTEAQHHTLLTLIKTLSCSIAISGYASDLYFDELRDWRHISFQVSTRGKAMATEYLWMNYPEPTVLHDYRYVGENFRKRASLAKQKKRWRARLERMNPLQRDALMEAIRDLDGPAAPKAAL